METLHITYVMCFKLFITVSSEHLCVKVYHVIVYRHNDMIMILYGLNSILVE